MSNNKWRIYATCHIGDAAENQLRERGYDLEIFPGPEAPPKSLIVEKAGSGIDGLCSGEKLWRRHYADAVCRK